MLLPPQDSPPAPVPPPDPLEALYQRLEAKVRQTRPTEDLDPLRKAFEFAVQLHADQRRDSGEPYMAHPLEVTLILAGMMMDQETLISGILHDVVEDTPVKLDEIKRRFGEDVARIVDGVTKLSKIQFYSREDRQAESVRKMLLAMVSDVRVIIVKLADRLHNCRTLDGIKDPERRKRIAQETIEIYAPIANRLGMGKVRGELEDLAFRHIDPEAHGQVIHEIETTRQASEEFLDRIKKIVEKKMRENAIPARVEARMKRPYSVYLKLQKQRIGIDQVYDLLALRIITDSVKNCYAALGVIHNEWHPIPGRIKDFIAIPRPNLYQSLHTSVMGPDGQPFEVQFRTEEMHRVAEEGIAAHWKYKEGKRGQAAGDERIAWMRQLVEWQKEMRDPGDFMSTLKRDLHTEEVYCFTPAGKVIMLAQGGCPIDFAYAVHSDVGHRCIGAKVNGRIVPLKYELKNGDVVEILTHAGHSPSKDWLSFVKTSKARNRIKHVINATERVKAIEIGEKYLEKEARRLGVSLSKIARSQLEAVSLEYGYPKIEDLHAALGYGKYSPRQVLHKLVPELVEESEPPRTEPAAPPRPDADDQDLVLTVDGMNDLLINLAKCCNPIKGEPIVGYVTRGKGVMVHAKDCKNVDNLLYEAERRVNVEWTRASGRSYRVRLTVYSDDRLGILNQLTSVLFAENSNIQSLETREDTERGEGKIIDVTTDVRDKKQLEKITATLRRISGVRHVDRIQ